MVVKNYLQSSNGEADIENRLVNMGRGEERVRCMERVTWKLTICKIDSQWEFAVWLRNLKRGLYQPRWVRWAGSGREVQEGGGIWIPMADPC